MMTGILNHSLMASIQFHDTLHRIRISRVTGTTSLESRLLQQLITIREEVIYKIFLYLHKVGPAVTLVPCPRPWHGFVTALPTHCYLPH